MKLKAKLADKTQNTCMLNTIIKYSLIKKAKNERNYLL